MTNNILILIASWIVLGIHSAYYFVRKFTKKHDLTTSEIPMIVACVLFPLATHLATWIVYADMGWKVSDTKSKVIFKKRTN